MEIKYFNLYRPIWFGTQPEDLTLLTYDPLVRSKLVIVATVASLIGSVRVMATCPTLAFNL